MDDWQRVKLAVQRSGVSRSKIYELDRKYGGVLKQVEGMAFASPGRIQEIIAEAQDEKAARETATA
jgi:hypothetical protein